MNNPTTNKQTKLLEFKGIYGVAHVPFNSRTDTFTICYCTSAFADGYISTPRPRPRLSPLAAALGVLRLGDVLAPLCLAPVSPRHKKQSAVSSTPRYHFGPLLAALGHTPFLLRTANGAFHGPLGGFENPEFVCQTLGQLKLFPGRPGLGFSPLAIFLNITRRISRSLAVRCTPPAKRGGVVYGCST